MSERVWKVGDVAMVTYRLGACTETNVCAKTDKGWDCLAPGVGFLMHGDVIDARPLVVIDPEDREQRAGLLADFYFARGEGASELDAMHYALKKFADPAPPRPDEPQGLGAVVEDDQGEKWIRVMESPERRSWAPYGEVSLISAWRGYADIAVVRVLSEGVTE